MASAELIVDVHHHYMPAALFDRLAAQAGGRRIVTNEISLTLHPSRKDLEAHLKVMDEAGVTVSIVTDQVQVLGAEVARLLNDGIAEVERKHPTRFRGCIHLPIHEPEAAKRELERGINELGLRAVALLACHLDVQLDNPTMNPALRSDPETPSAHRHPSTVETHRLRHGLQPGSLRLPAPGDNPGHRARDQ